MLDSKSRNQILDSLRPPPEISEIRESLTPGRIFNLCTLTILRYRDVRKFDISEETYDCLTEIDSILVELRKAWSQ